LFVLGALVGVFAACLVAAVYEIAKRRYERAVGAGAVDLSA
jgi:hypothetical protein